jgi:hypothetical protein
VSLQRLAPNAQQPFGHRHCPPMLENLLDQVGHGAILQSRYALARIGRRDSTIDWNRC